MSKTVLWVPLPNIVLVSNQPDVYHKLINGKPLKSINQYFNQKKAFLMSFIGDRGTSHSIARLSRKREQKMDDYLHKAMSQPVKIFPNMSDEFWTELTKLVDDDNDELSDIAFA
ncbi:Transposase, IS605 OrfB [Beggiatoa sp. PS]|nr:Transposase, IS605 OrfB [Beggiatoa sp. PS]